MTAEDNTCIFNPVPVCGLIIVFIITILNYPVFIYAENNVRNKRMLWEVRTGGGDDSFSMLYPASGKLLAIRNGRLIAYDSATGECIWKFPSRGKIRFHDYHEHLSSVTVIGDTVVFAPPFWSKVITGCAAVIRLSDGELLRKVNISQEYGFPDTGYLNRTECFARRGSHYGVFLAIDKKREKSQILVIDLHTWKSVLRCDINGRIDRRPDVYRGYLYGRMGIKEEPYARLFTVNLKSKEMYSIPMRKAKHQISHRPLLIVPDGTIYIYDGRFSEKCAYMNPIPLDNILLGYYRALGNNLYAWGLNGFYRINPETGKEYWHIDMRHCRTPRVYTRISGNKRWVVFVHRLSLYAADAETGKLRLGLRVVRTDHPLYNQCFSHESKVWDKICLACDSRRVYYTLPHCLRCCSLKPVSPDRPDPYDPGDPAYTLQKTRKAMQKGEYKDAMKHLYGISVQVRLRPSMRAKTASLFSQLSRSSMPRRYPKQWENLIINEGWIAGELFIEQYRNIAPRKDAMTALCLSGKKGLQIAAGMLKQYRGKRMSSYTIAAAAYEKLNGTYPYRKILKGSSWKVGEEILSRTVPDSIFKELLPDLKANGIGQNKLCYYNVGYLPPHQLLALLPENPEDEYRRRMIEAAKRQLESQKNKEGERMDIKIWGKSENKKEVF